MLLGLYFLLIAGLTASIISAFLYRDTERYKFLFLLAGSFFFTITDIGTILQRVLFRENTLLILKWLVQWGEICCIAVVLCSLLFFLRELRPKAFRIPKEYSLIPLLIIVSFFLVYDSDVLKNSLLIIYEAAAITVAIVVHTRYYLRHKIFRTSFVGSLMLLVSFIVYLILPRANALVSELILAAGIITIFSGYLIVNNYTREKVKRSYNVKI